MVDAAGAHVTGRNYPLGFRPHLVAEEEPKAPAPPRTDARVDKVLLKRTVHKSRSPQCSPTAIQTDEARAGLKPKHACPIILLELSISLEPKSSLPVTAAPGSLLESKAGAHQFKLRKSQRHAEWLGDVFLGYHCPTPPPQSQGGSLTKFCSKILQVRELGVTPSPTALSRIETASWSIPPLQCQLIRVL